MATHVPNEDRRGAAPRAAVEPRPPARLRPADAGAAALVAGWSDAAFVRDALVAGRCLFGSCPLTQTLSIRKLPGGPQMNAVTVWVLLLALCVSVGFDGPCHTMSSSD